MKSIIKKELYKQKPTAIEQGISVLDIKVYQATLKDGTRVVFEVPMDEVSEIFTEEMPAQLLIRWISLLRF